MLRLSDPSPDPDPESLTSHPNTDIARDPVSDPDLAHNPVAMLERKHGPRTLGRADGTSAPFAIASPDILCSFWQTLAPLSSFDSA